MAKNQIIDPFKELAAGLSKEKGFDIWEEEPVDIEHFVCDKEFLNLKWNGKTGCRPKILEILKDVARDEVREAMLLLGKGCLAGDTVIWTKHGPRKMKGLAGKRVKVQSRTRDNIDIWNDGLCLSRGIKNVKKYTFSNGMFLKATDNHLFDVVGKGDLCAKDMKIGDFIHAPRRLLPPVESKHDNPYLYRLVGLLLGDGTITNSKRVGLTVAHYEVLAKYFECITKLDRKAIVSFNPPYFWFIRQTYNRHCEGRPEYLQWCKLYSTFDELGLIGQRAKTKKIPLSMMCGSSENIAELLSGLFSTDGWVECGKNNNVGLPTIFYSSRSKQLLHQIKLLLLRFGVCATLRWKKKRCKLKSWNRARKLWGGFLEISGHEDLVKFLDNIDLYRDDIDKIRKIVYEYDGVSMKPLDQIPKKLAEQYLETRSRGKNGVARYRFRRDSNVKHHHLLNVHWVDLVKIEDCGQEEVFDIICENPNHNYCANGLYPENSGKDFLASIMHLYGIYKALCLYDPQGYYGLAPGSPIYFVNVARNEGQAKNVFFTQFLGMLENCPWFQGKCEPPSSNTVKFDKRIRALSGNSQAFGWLGYNTIQWVGDELAFFLENDSNEESESKAEECWEAAYGSCQTRFPQHYKMFGITTPRYEDDFVMRKCDELQGRADGCFVQAATWDIHPNLTKEDFKNSLIRNYRRAMRDFGAQPMGIIESFWSEPEFVEENVCQTCRECDVYQNRIINTDDYICRSCDSCKANGYVGNGVWRDWFVPDGSVEYCIHFDLSKNKDRLAFAVGHVHGNVKLEVDIFERVKNTDKMDEEERMEKTYEDRPLIKIDAIGWIDPRNVADSDMLKNREIHYHGVFNKIIVALRNKGFNISIITFDQYQCLVGSTLVNTSKGIVPLRNVRVGDIVPTRIGPRKVKKVLKYFNAPTVKVTTKSDNSICGTPNHRIEVLDRWVQGGDRKSPNPRKYFWKWKPLGEIRVGDVVRMSDCFFSEQVDVGQHQKMLIPDKFTNTSTSRYNNVELPTCMHEEFAELLGIIWGDGNFQRGGDVVSITGTVDEIEYVRHLVMKVFNFKPLVDDKGEENCVSCQWSSKLLGNYFRANNLIKKPYDKRLGIPKVILRSPKHIVGAFLRGMYSTDGSVDKNDGSSTLVTSSFKMAKQVKYVMQMKFGIRSTISRRHLDGSDSCFGKYGTIYNVKTTGSRRDFHINIGFCYERKESILKRHTHRPGRILCERVEKVENTGLRDVYDLTIEEEHSYVANGFISHNSLYMKQQVVDLGIESELLSTDRTDEVPVAAKRAFVENRVEYPYNRILCSEAKKLKYLKGKKVDHPEKGSKDIFDSVACVIHNCERLSLSTGCFTDLSPDED